MFRIKQIFKKIVLSLHFQLPCSYLLMLLAFQTSQREMFARILVLQFKKMNNQQAQ